MYLRLAHPSKNYPLVLSERKTERYPHVDTILQSNKGKPKIRTFILGIQAKIDDNQSRYSPLVPVSDPR